MVNAAIEVALEELNLDEVTLKAFILIHSQFLFIKASAFAIFNL